jgi:hypothetical protein
LTVEIALTDKLDSSAFISREGGRGEGRHFRNIASFHLARRKRENTKNNVKGTIAPQIGKPLKKNWVTRLK